MALNQHPKEQDMREKGGKKEAVLNLGSAKKKTEADQVVILTARSAIYSLLRTH